MTASWNAYSTLDEQAAIRARPSDADLELWSRWAAKETGFKVISKLIGCPASVRASRIQGGLDGVGQQYPLGANEDELVRAGSRHVHRA